METIIGLGNAGCSIAEQFSRYPQYEVYRIDSKKRPGKKFKLIPKCKSHEEYEEKCPSMKTFFKNVSGSCLFIVGGSGTISGASLRILEAIKDREINILYIKPDIEFLSDTKYKQHRAVFQILQQFARSNLFKRMYIVENEKISQILGDLPIAEYYNKINEFIASSIHMVNVFDHTESVINTFSDPAPTAKISTFGVVDVDSEKEQNFYDIELPREKRYYYAIKKDVLSEKNELFSKIKKQIKNISKKDDKMRVSYGIFSTEYENNFAYSITSATLIQEQE